MEFIKLLQPNVPGVFDPWDEIMTFHEMSELKADKFIIQVAKDTARITAQAGGTQDVDASVEI